MKSHPIPIQFRDYDYDAPDTAASQTHRTALPRAVNAAAQLRPASNLQFAILRPASNFLQHFQNQVHHGYGRPAINKKIEPDQAWPVPTHQSTFDNTRIFLAFTRPGEIRRWQGRIWSAWSLQYVSYYLAIFKIDCLILQEHCTFMLVREAFA